MEAAGGREEEGMKREQEEGGGEAQRRQEVAAHRLRSATIKRFPSKRNVRRSRDAFRCHPSDKKLPNRSAFPPTSSKCQH